MNFLQSEEQRIKKTIAEERDLHRRLTKKIRTCRLFMLASGCLIVTAVTVGLIAMLVGGDSGAWAFPIMLMCCLGAGFFHVFFKKSSEGLGIMKATLKEYRDFLGKMKEKGKV